MPPTATPEAGQVLADTRRWLERAVIGLNLCPFASAVHLRQQIRWVVSQARTEDALVKELARELRLLADADPASAQVAAAPGEHPATEATDNSGPIGFEADQVQYNDKSEDVTASGNVILRRSGQSLRADNVMWNRSSGKIIANGNIRMVDEDGNQLFTEHVELTDELKAGAMQGMLLVLQIGRAHV
mgnify:CR=1 FL=1